MVTRSSGGVPAGTGLSNGATTGCRFAIGAAARRASSLGEALAVCAQTSPPGPTAAASSAEVAPAPADTSSTFMPGRTLANARNSAGLRLASPLRSSSVRAGLAMAALYCASAAASGAAKAGPASATAASASRARERWRASRFCVHVESLQVRLGERERCPRRPIKYLKRPARRCTFTAGPGPPRVVNESAKNSSAGSRHCATKSRRAESTTIGAPQAYTW